MRTTTSHFKCDRCGDHCDDKDVLGLAMIKFESSGCREPTDYSAGFVMSGGTSPFRIEADWCRKCRVAVGLLVPLPTETDAEKPAEVVAPTPAPTLEDLLRELIREEIASDTR